MQRTSNCYTEGVVYWDNTAAVVYNRKPPCELEFAVLLINLAYTSDLESATSFKEYKYPEVLGGALKKAK